MDLPLKKARRPSDTHVIPLSALWRSKDLRDHAQPGETSLDVLHAGILVGTSCQLSLLPDRKSSQSRVGSYHLLYE